MNTNQRPPIAQKKGIAVLQSSRTQKIIENEEYSSGIRSIRSSSRSRGISISRSSGIKMDKIYQQKHFPLPSRAPEQIKSSQNLQKTLTSCKSLKLVSVQSEATISNVKDSQLKFENNSKQESELKTNSKVQAKDARSSSPIGKLIFPSPSSQISKTAQNQKQRRLVNF